MCLNRPLSFDVNIGFLVRSRKLGKLFLSIHTPQMTPDLWHEQLVTHNVQPHPLMSLSLLKSWKYHDYLAKLHSLRGGTIFDY